ncbi:L,D-transpeptidase family protein [Parvularcula maris]|uniref:L,D-transpeptidase family protein n=1 Tax=Parvularcula maris TaxID=2965077 RepID=A0A9X2RIT4_9PROT|nr:L,D-transpeptidase family protein [Parvularcula maris]MCQ8186389.1 L,D-transpeptidase family protein [Parvularcula maris]
MSIVASARPALLLAAISGLCLAAPEGAASDHEKKVAAQAEHVLAAAVPDLIHRYYDEGGTRLFTADKRGRENIRQLIEEIEKLEAAGLNPEDYGLSAMKTAAPLGGDRLEAAGALALTALASDLRDGVSDPLIVYTEEELERGEASRAELLREAALASSVSDFLQSLRTDNLIEMKLNEALRTYIAYAEEEAWEPLALSAEVLEEGDEGADVRAVEERLAAEGFYRLPIESEVEPAFTLQLKAAVEAFQESRGIATDGVVGPSTLARMNETPDELVEAIRLNLERARWLPQDFAERHLFVNIANYTVDAFEGEERVFSIRTVVGTTYNQTPVFADEMEYVVANPYWNIPRSILVEEVAPAQAKDPTYLERKNMEVVEGWQEQAPLVDPASIDWSSVDGDESWRVRQRGGPSNALGLIKFIFPNRYSVYLHDSPAESLFGRTERAFSHGCIRVEEPAKLAEWVLEGTDYESREAIDELLASERREQIFLPEKLPVYVAYLTVWPDTEGRVKFLEDIYDRDEPLRQALSEGRQKAGRQVAALLR